MSRLAPGMLLATVLMCVPGLARPDTLTFAQEPVGSLPRAFTADLTGEGLPGLWGVVTDPEAAGGRALEQRTPDLTDYHFLSRSTSLWSPGRRGEHPVQNHLRQGRPGWWRGRAPDRLAQVLRGAGKRARGQRPLLPRRRWPARADRRHRPAGYPRRLAHADPAGRRGPLQGLFRRPGPLTATDRTFGGAGRIALWTKADSVTRFDRISITPLGEPPQEQAAGRGKP